LRILQVVPTYYPAVRYGGPIRSVHGLAKSLSQRGHEVHVYTTTLDGPLDLDVPTDRPVPMDGVYVHYFRVPVLRRLAWSPAMRAMLKRTVASFDVVHLHSVFLWPTWAAARAASRAGVPYLIAPRGSLVRALIDQKSRWLKKTWIALIERRSIARAAGLHVTAALEQADVEALRLPARKIYCVPNGLDIPDASRGSQEGPFAYLRKPYALFVGRLHWKKGLDRLIRSWRTVADLPLIIVGNDETGYGAELAQIAQTEGVADRVIFAGPASDEDKWALYANAELTILPSYSENFGNVVVEAMAVGCPVVVTETVGSAATVREAGAGVISDGAPANLAQAINTIHQHGELRQSMGRKGRDYVTAHLLWPAVASDMQAVYEEITRDAKQPDRQLSHPQAAVR
jgi:glycosyltransferase involved in cell wall biosynthesis